MPGNHRSGQGGLRPELVREVKSRLDRGQPLRELARELGVSRGVVRRIARGFHCRQRNRPGSYLRNARPLEDPLCAIFWRESEPTTAEEARLDEAIARAADRVFEARRRWEGKTAVAEASAES